MIHSLVTAELTGADISSTLRRAGENGLTILCAVPKNVLTVQVTLHWREYLRFQQLCEKQGDRLKILGSRGVYWKGKALLLRPVLLLGLLLMIILTLYLPSRILFVQVEGNTRIPSQKILEQAEKCGIRFGASRRAVRSERMKNALLESIPELQWAGINTRGCIAVITVREQAEQGSAPAVQNFGHIVAMTDAVITDCNATCGTLLCSPGQAVKAGQILISGYTDTGLTIRPEHASGEIFGNTRRFVQAVTPSFSYQVSKTGNRMKKISLILGKKRINLWKDSGISHTTCDRMYEEYYITLPGGFQLPMSLVLERYSEIALVQREIFPDQAELLLDVFAENYLKQTMIAGMIRTREISITEEPGVAKLAGEYRCTELIGVMQRLQIGEENGKNH